MKTNSSSIIVKTLEGSGVEYIFGLPGEENLSLLDEIRKSTIKFITTRDEQTATFMAATVGRLTGKLGVALSTLGPGATNLVTGVAYAQLGGMPLLVITGQKPLKKSKQGKFQIIDVVGMMKPITKYAYSIESADKAPTAIIEAIRHAELERPGAVHLEVAEDIALEETENKIFNYSKVRRPDPDDKSLVNLVDAIDNAKKPLLIIGAGANRKLITKQLNNFISKTNIPFVSTQMGKGVADESSDLFIGTTALSDGDLVHKAIELSDLLIMVGHDTIEKPPVINTHSTKVIHLNFYPAEIDEVYSPDLEIIGDVSYALWHASEKVKSINRDYSDIFRIKKLIDNQLEKSKEDSSFPIAPSRFVYELRDMMPKDSILSLDNGMYKLWISRNYKVYTPNSLLLDNALATMGAGFPAGMAAKLINPDKKVVVVAGDGGFMMNLADLETAKRLNLDLVIVVLNDQGYGMIKWKQDGMNLEDYALDFTNPDFVKLAESFGAIGHRINSIDNFKEVFTEAINSKGVHIIDLPIDYSYNKLLNKSELEKTISELMKGE